MAHDGRRHTATHFLSVRVHVRRVAVASGEIHVLGIVSLQAAIEIIATRPEGRRTWMIVPAKRAVDPLA
jgi:hypothetical protein